VLKLRMAEIINLAAAREQKETTAQESLFALIEADFPGYNAPKLQALWDAFGLSVPCNLSEERQIELWVAVSGRLGRHLEMLARHTNLFNPIIRDQQPAYAGYLEAVLAGNRSEAARLATEQRILENLPVLC